MDLLACIVAALVMTASLSSGIWDEVASPLEMVESAGVDGTDRPKSDQARPPSGPFPPRKEGQFIENLGQAGDAGGVFYALVGGAAVAFHPGRVTVVLEASDVGADPALRGYEIVFEGAEAAEPRGVGPTGTRYNFFLGDDPSRWVSGARGFAQVRYEGLWDGIDLVYRSADGQLKYDLIVGPGGDASSIAFSYTGAESVSMDASSGELCIATSSGTVRDARPISYQDGHSDRCWVDSRFRPLGARTVGFEVGAYDRSRPLVIDPQLLFSTFLGTGSDDYAVDCHTDPAGDLFVLGVTSSSVFPTTSGALDETHNGQFDVVVSKLSSDGSQLLYCTYIGGNDDDNSLYGSGPGVYAGYGGIYVDDAGAVYVTGHTTSSNFPTTAGAYDRTQSSTYDGFVLKLAPAGDRLEFSTYIGGTENAHPIDICVNTDGEPIVSGYTWGAFPTTAGAFDTTFNGGNDAFVSKLSSTGDRLVCSTFIGGNNYDIGYAVAVDGQGLVHVAGYTQGSGFPVKSGSYDIGYNGGGYDMFVLKLNRTWQSLEYCTYIGGGGNDMGTDLAVDDLGRAYVCGISLISSGFPTVGGCYDTSWNGDVDAVVARLNPTGSTLERSTYYGTSADDRAYGIELAPNGDVTIGGYSSGSPPTTSDAQSSANQGDYDALLARFDANLTTLRYASLFGSSGLDQAWDVALNDGGDTMFLVGHTLGSDFPTTARAYDTTYNGGSSADSFALRVGVANPPSWRGLPTIAAVEDVPLSYDFSSLVMDHDTPPESLRVSSSSQYVRGTKGLEAQFLFPNGVTRASVPMTLDDGFSSAEALVNFTVEPVNDPPRCTVETRHRATEDVPYTIDFGACAVDVDNSTSDLRLLVDSPYATVSGLNLTVTFPEGISSHVIWVNVTDGLLAVEVRLEFTVTPIDDPPVVLPLPPFLAVEDRDSVFNITPYLTDVDTPVLQLRVLVREENCTVFGKELHFLFHRPVIDLAVPLEVADASSRVFVTLLVSASPVNDPPVVGMVPPQTLVEGEQGSVDLSPYIMDEDTPEGELVLGCSSPRFVRSSGLNLMLLFDVWQPEHTVDFSVFDGIAYANGSFTVQVMAVNDPPVILGLGDLVPPVVISMQEGEELRLEVHAQDEDNTLLRYGLDSPWNGITVFQNGSVRVVALQADVGTHHANLTVDDLTGGTTTLAFTVIVINVDDPPTMPIITRPLNHTTVEEGTNVTFKVDVYDPDVTLGQTLTVAWVSNISGLLMTLTSDEPLQFTTNALPVGVHRIDVSVTDGTHVRSGWLELTVIERYVPPPPPPEEPSFFTQPTGIAAIAAVILLVAVVALIGITWTRSKAANRDAEEARRAAEAAQQIVTKADAEIMMEGDLTRLSHDLGDMVTKLEAQRAAEATVYAAHTPAAQLESIAVPASAEEEADRERTRETREVMRALTQLPQGLPTSLSGWDMAELARTIVDGAKRSAADGTPLVQIKGRWYCADRGNVGTFAREWKEPEPAAGGPLTDAERERRLQKLEEALIEGKITEQTYKDLKGKYERG